MSAPLLCIGLPVSLDIDLVDLLKRVTSAIAGSLDQADLTRIGCGGQKANLVLRSAVRS